MTIKFGHALIFISLTVFLALSPGCAVWEFIKKSNEVENSIERADERIKVYEALKGGMELKEKFPAAKKEFIEAIRHPRKTIKKHKKIHEEKCKVDAFGGKICTVHEVKTWKK